MSEVLVVTESLSYLRKELFTRVVSETDKFILAFVGPFKVTCVTTAYLQEHRLRSWCCGRHFAQIQVAAPLSDADTVYLISRVTGKCVEDIPELLGPLGTYLLPAFQMRYEGILYKLPTPLIEETVGEVANLIAGFPDEEFLSSLERV